MNSEIQRLENCGVNIIDSQEIELAYGAQELEIIATGTTKDRIEELGWNFRCHSNYGLVARLPR